MYTVFFFFSLFLSGESWVGFVYAANFSNFVLVSGIPVHTTLDERRTELYYLHRVIYLMKLAEALLSATGIQIYLNNGVECL
ncbi:hypothetical protein CGRA01v4_01357 [Colletotrichum graminicola]|nr:hypothetical protein CGRA01v4_01357 [Colletotrichum graminicola]